MTWLSILVTLIVLSILILIHEFGHFLIAKKSGILVEEFGIGYPPRIFGMKIRETLYSINLFPIGGFVRLYGEEGDREDGRDKKTEKQQDKKKGWKGRAFYDKPLWIKSAVVAGGVVMNVLLAIGLFSVVYSIIGIPEASDEVIALEVQEGSPAEKAGLQAGDELARVAPNVCDQLVTGRMIDNEVINRCAGEFIVIDKLEDFSNFVAEYKGKQIFVNISRQMMLDESAREWLYLVMVPREEYDEKVEGPTGVTIVTGIKEVFYPWWQMPFRGAWAGIQEAFGWTRLIISELGKMFWNWIAQGEAPKGVGGVVEVGYIVNQAVKLGIIPVMQLMGILSLNLAVINLLPFPAIDGGRLTVLLIEGITRRKLKYQIEHWLNMIGFFILILLVVYITINDVNRRLGHTWWVMRIKEWLMN